MMNDVLPDVLDTGLRVVFCGTAASEKSAAVGAPYANPTNKFWRALFDIGMIPRHLPPTDFRTVTRYGIGITDMAKGAIGNDDVLTPSDFDSDSVTQKIEQYQPHVLAFTSKRAYREWRGISPTKPVSYGWQAETIGQTKIYVLTSPSGAASRYWDIAVWQNLADACQLL